MVTKTMTGTEVQLLDGAEMAGDILGRVGREIISGPTVPCRHCGGRGECYCPVCSASRGIEDCREEPDTGRQGEGQCGFCDGLGRTRPSGLPLSEE